MPTPDRPSAVELHDVTFIRDGRALLSDVDLEVLPGERWAVLGPNGAGKSTLLNICGAVTFPSRGWARILGHRMGEVDLRELRQHIGFVNPRHPLRSDLSVEDVVLTGATGTIERVPRWQPSRTEQERADVVRKTLGIDGAEPLHWHTMSQGERGRALIARALMTDPPLLLLDEPTTGLDLAAREQMIRTFDTITDTLPGLTTVTVTHHFEELPPTTTHALLLRAGRVVASGTVDQVLTDEAVSECFAHPVRVTRTSGPAGGRWHAVTG